MLMLKALRTHALLLTAASPAPFRSYGPFAVLSACGAGIAALGVAGLVAHAERGAMMEA